MESSKAPSLQKLRLLICFFSCCFFGVILPAQAQIEEVIVTAQKRTESVQKVPLSVTAFDAAGIRAVGMQNVEDVATQVPNLLLQDNGVVARFGMRGVNLNSITDVSESPIAIYNDGVYLGSSSNFRTTLFDLQRIEVVRGPQGTLYGRNATGGLIHFISKEPTEEFDAFASAEYGRFSKLIVESAVGGRLSERLRARASVKYDTDDGIQRNLVDGSHWYKTDQIAGRLQLAIDISDGAELLLSAHGSHNNGNSQGYNYLGARDPADPTFATLCSNERVLNWECVSSTGERGTNDPTKVMSPFSVPPKLDAKQSGGLARLIWKVADTVTLTSLSAYEKIDKFHEEDTTASLGGGGLNVALTNDYSQFSQEVRLNGTYGAFDWVGGVYYFKSEADSEGLVRFRTLGVPAGPFGSLLASKLDTNAWALFGDVKYAVTDTVTLSGGLRYSDEKKDHVGVNTFAVLFGFGGPVPIDETVSLGLVTGRVALDWQATDDVLLYANYSTGFKSPGYQAQAIFTTDPFANRASDKEELHANEVGMKSYWFDKHVRLNVAGFYYDYAGLQQILTVPSQVLPGINTPVLSNVDEAYIYGAEIEFDWVPDDRWDFGARFGYLHSKVHDSDPAFDGNEVSVAPHFSYTLMGGYHLPLGEKWGTLSLQAHYRWQDSVFFGIDNLPLATFHSFGVVDSRLVWKSVDKRYTVEAFADNLADEEYFVHSYAVGSPGDGMAGVWGMPRTYGVRLTVDF